MMYICYGILFSYKEEGNPAMCYNLSEPGGHYPNWKWAKYRRINSTWYHLDEESKIVKVIEAEFKMVVVRGWREGRIVVLVKGYKVSLYANEKVSAYYL